MQIAAQRSKRIGLIVRIGLGVAILGYGIYIAEPRAPRLMIFGLTLFALPLMFQFLPWALARIYAIWFGAFLVLQGLLTPILLSDAYLVAHAANLTWEKTFAEGAYPGISGVQRVTTDERGFRVNPRVDYAHKSGIRLFAIGGSTTADMDIDDELTWTHRLQVALAQHLGKPLEVINTGVSGLRTRHHITTFQDILPLQPDIVLFLVGMNDWHFDTHVEFGANRVVGRLMFPDTLLGRIARAQYSRYFRTPTERIVSTRIETIDMSTRRSLERERKIAWFPDAASDQYRANLLRISDICRANQLTCVFLTQPNAYSENATQELKDLFWMTPAYVSYTLTFESLIHIARLYNRTLVDFAHERGHPVCDLASRLEPTTEYFADDVHFTLAGAARVAELVTDCIKPLVARFH